MTDETKKGKILLGFRKPEVDPTNPWQDDLLGRQEIAQRITTIVTSVATTVDQNLQLSLNGPWGSGKTWMLQRLQKHLENQGLRAIYYNTWEDDFCQDPLMGILGQLHLKLRNYSSYRQTLKELEKTARRIAAAAGLSATRHIGLDMGQVIRAINHDPLKQYKRERESLEKLRGLLKDIGRHTMELTQNPLVLILDELDRCRPEYAVKCLERIKHLMEVPGIVFLLGINRDQLCEAIQHANGIRDPSMYLQRFFDLEFNIPNASQAHFCQMKMAELGITNDMARETQEDKPGRISDYWQHNMVNLTTHLPMICKAAELTLRETEHCVRMTALAIRTMDMNVPVNTNFLLALPILKLKNPEIYRRFSQERCSTVEVTDCLDELTAGKLEHPSQNALLQAQFTLLWANEKNDETAAINVGLLREGKKPDNPESLPRMLRGADKQKIQRLVETTQENKPSITMMVEYLDLYQVPISRF